MSASQPPLKIMSTKQAPCVQPASAPNNETAREAALNKTINDLQERLNKARDQLDASREKVDALHDELDEERRANALLRRTNDELERLAADQAAKIRVLEDSNNRRVAVEQINQSTAATTNPVPINRQPAVSISGIPEDERRVLLGVYEYWLGVYMTANGENRETHVKVRNRGIQYSQDSIIQTYIHPLDPRYAGIRAPTMHHWRKALTDEKHKHEVKNEDKAALEEEIEKILTPLVTRKSMFSINHAFDVIQVRWQNRRPCPSRSFVAQYIVQNMTRFKTEEVKVAREVLDERKNKFQMELCYTLNKFSIDPSLVFNLDESAVRQIPQARYTWVYNSMDADDVLRQSGLLDRVPLKRVYTTLVCCTKMDGTYCMSQINVKGTERLIISEYEDQILQYPQKKSHWGTVESTLNYVQKVILPAVRATCIEKGKEESSTRWILVLDCAPIHASKKFIDGFHKLTQTGMLVFLPAGGTSETQPLDLSFFAPFKKAMNYQQLALLNGPLQYVSLTDKTKLLLPTKAARAITLKAILDAQNKVAKHPSQMKYAWEACLGYRAKVKVNGVEQYSDPVKPLGATKAPTIETYIMERAKAAQSKLAADEGARTKYMEEYTSWEKNRATNEIPKTQKPPKPDPAWLFARYGFPWEPHWPTELAAEEDETVNESHTQRLVNSQVVFDDSFRCPVDPDGGEDSDDDIDDQTPLPPYLLPGYIVPPLPTDAAV